MNDRPGWIKPAFSVLLGLLCAGPAGAALGVADSSAPGASASSTRSICLEYRELGYSAWNWGVPITLQSAPFRKEPDLGQRKVHRGTLKFGDSTEAFVPFIWDHAQGKLYLDLNRNRDLTDDADGVFACKGPPLGPFQTFGRVRMPFQTPLGTERVALDLVLGGFRATPNANALAYYCWEGKVTQGGQEWQLALVDNLFGKIGSAETGSLIIRPWADRGEAIDLQYGSLYSMPFTRNVFFGQQALHLDCSLARQDDNLKYRLNLTERAEPLGELKIAGQYIHRLVLSPVGSSGARVPGVPLTVILDSPGPVVSIPLGAYQYQLSLKQGAVEACPLPGRYVGPAWQLVVSGASAATLAAGGPLTNSVSVTRRGRSLAMGYCLPGAQGVLYQLQGSRKEPQFAIYRPGKSGDKKLASGAFQFG